MLAQGKQASRTCHRVQWPQQYMQTHPQEKVHDLQSVLDDTHIIVLVFSRQQGTLHVTA